MCTNCKASNDENLPTVVFNGEALCCDCLRLQMHRDALVTKLAGPL